MDEEAQFEAWKAAKAGTGDDQAFAAWKAKKKPLAPPPVAGSDATAVTPNPKEEEDDHTPVAQHIAETVVSGFPGAQRAVAGYRGLVSLLSGEGIDAAGNEVNNALEQQRRHVEQMPWMARLPLQMAGGAPAAALAAPLGIVKGGAAFGAAAGVDRPASSVADRAKNTGLGAAFGAFGAKAGEQAGELVGNLATRTGVTDRAAKAIEKIPSFKLDRQVPRATGADVAATMGTRGQVNHAFAERQDILDAIGAQPGTGAEQQMNRIAATQKQAQHLYGIARQDTQAIQDPTVSALLTDPQIKRAYQIASQIRQVSGNPLPSVEAPPQVPLALQKMGVTPERFAELQKVGESRRVPMAGVDILPPELLGEQSNRIELPDPQVLASLKRYLGNAAEGNMESHFPVKQEEAIALFPKVMALRDKLHEISPAWAKADAAYADAKGQEEAFINGYDAMRHSKSTVGKKLPQNSPEAMIQQISEPRYPGEPRGAMARRANAFREGIKAATSDQVRDASVDKNLTDVMKVPALGATENASEVRNLMRAPGEPTTLEDILPAKRAELLKSGNSPVPAGRFGRMGRAVTNIGRERDAFGTEKGQSLLAQRLANRPLQSSEIAKFRTGDKATDYLRKLLSIDAGGQLAR